MDFKIRISKTFIPKGIKVFEHALGCKDVKEIRKLLKMPELNPALIKGNSDIRLYDICLTIPYTQACGLECFESENESKTYLICASQFSKIYIDRIITLERSKTTDEIKDIKLSYQFNVYKVLEAFIAQGGKRDTRLIPDEPSHNFCNTIIEKGGGIN